LIMSGKDKKVRAKESGEESARQRTKLSLFLAPKSRKGIPKETPQIHDLRGKLCLPPLVKNEELGLSSQRPTNDPLISYE